MYVRNEKNNTYLITNGKIGTTPAPQPVKNSWSSLFQDSFFLQKKNNTD